MANVHLQGSHSKRLLLAAGRCWLCLSLIFCAAARAEIGEPQLRAGVVVGVLRYTSWLTPGTSNSLNVCGLGETPGFSALAQSQSNISVADKTLVFKTLENINGTDDCAVVIVGAGVNKKKLAALKQLPVLSICDTCEYPDQHAVALFMSNQRIRFSVDRTLAQHAGVQFSAAMLELAAKVEP